ncbi:hypothetical protein [Defluviimonas sp. WL0075]|uniref:Uncharacterized protein n=1 Tax=Albidovulum sediminicola TaxID=2984331 RepID=A0ABT2Z5H6_9RHOB|nr:hypothetical protein [Defluviimonas sp. WL0075]MCV2866404.1 hypothetical protein [Defluviimonas sp. WL0075]
MRILLAATALAAAWSGTGAWADDHLANGATAPGAAARGFANPVAANPSDTSGGASDPGTVPGLGNPNAGADRGTPAFDPVSLEERLAERAGPQG